MIDGIKVECNWREDARVRTLEQTPVVEAHLINERECDILAPKVRYTWENELGGHRSEQVTLRPSRIRGGERVDIPRSAAPIPEDWQGQECSIHLEVEAGGEWKWVWTGHFKVDDIGLCPL